MNNIQKKMKILSDDNQNFLIDFCIESKTKRKEKKKN
jgi:hypothetical protein